MKALLTEIRSCSICSSYLPLGPRPILSAHPNSRIVVIGQAPGTKVHETGVPWDDPSGERLRSWMGVSQESFYDNEKFALVPMGFCYPGKGKSGDLPPRPECAPQWHEIVLASMKNLKLTLLVGSYAQDFYLKNDKPKTLTETVANWPKFMPKYFPLPHPSGRNNIWMKKNPWFEESVVPNLKQIIAGMLD